MRRVHQFGVGVIALLAIMPAFAQLNSGLNEEEGLEDLYGGEEFVSIATGSNKPIYKAPAVASVITARDIEMLGARSLNEVLETVPGLHVSMSTLSRINPVYSIRGVHTGYNSQVLLLIDGVPLQTPSTGGRPELFNLSVASIARIEVIRGPGSAVYGADAYSGVVSVITKDAKSIDGTDVGGRIGSFDSRDLWLQSGGQWNGLDVVFGLSYQSSNGDSDRIINSDLQTMLDGALGTNASLAPGSLSTNYEYLETRLGLKNDNWRVGFWGWNQDGSGIGAGGAQALDPSGTQTDDAFLVDVSYQTSDLVADWNFNTRLSYFFYDTQTSFRLLPPGAVVPIGSDGNLNFANPAGIVTFPDGLIGNPSGKAKDSQLEVVASYTGMYNHRWRFASGIRHQTNDSSETKNFGPSVIDGNQSVVDGTLTDVTGTSFIFLPHSSRTIHYLSLQDEWQFSPDWELTAGVRYDNYSDFGSTINPRVALVWATQHNLTTKLLYGSAFRAPSFSEQFIANNPVSLGNPDLDPETIDTLELSLNYRPMPELQSTLSLFTYEAQDLIEFVADSGATTQTAQNARNQDGYGFEWEASWKASRSLRLNANFSWQRSEDSDTKQRTHDAPGKQFYLNAHWLVSPQWLVNTQLNWVGSRKRAQGDLRENIDDYSLVNIAIRRKDIAPQLDLTVSVFNLFDEDAREPSNGTIPDDYPMEGRSIRMELQYRFDS